MLSHTEDHDLSSTTTSFSLADRWIRSRLEATLVQIEEAYENFRFDLASQALYDFIWNEFCDWYLELSKPVLWDESAEPAEAGRAASLGRCAGTIPSNASPVHAVPDGGNLARPSPLAGVQGDSIMLAPWPARCSDQIDTEAEQEIEWLKQIIVGIRTIRSESNIPPGNELPVFFVNASSLERERLKRNESYLGRLAKVSSIKVIESGEDIPASLMALCGDLEVRVPMAGVIDVSAELSRLDKELVRHEQEITKLSGKLSISVYYAHPPRYRTPREQTEVARDANVN